MKHADVVLDSSCWIAWFDASDARGDLVDDVVDAHDGRIVVPTVVMYEVARWLSRTGIDAHDVDTALSRLGREQSQDVTDTVALLAASLTKRHKLATADALIAASAAVADCQLVTFDRDFAKVPGTLVLPSPIR